MIEMSLEFPQIKKIMRNDGLVDIGPISKMAYAKKTTYLRNDLFFI
jgi:hypothetical protein